jgi:hypothetical protein
MIEPDANIVEIIRKLVNTANFSGTPLSTPIFRRKLGEYGHDISNGGCCVCYTLWGIITAVVNAATYFI